MYDIGDRHQSRVVPRMFNDMWCIGTAASMALIIVFGQNRELHTIRTEVKNGMVRSNQMHTHANTPTPPPLSSI